MPEVQFPEKLLFLINDPARYKILYGGRGGMKTESVAIALIILATQKKLRILCLREIQKSIDESVYETIKNRIIFRLRLLYLNVQDQSSYFQVFVIN